MTTKSSLGIYVHIPYCERKCLYCDFLSFPGYPRREEYLEALKREIRLAGEKYAEGRYADSIFIGGGTPSILSPEEAEGILCETAESFDIREDAEITMEVNPASLSLEKARGYLEAGVNRLSIGVQSFDEGVLKTLGRLHDSAEAAAAFYAAREAGFRNINLDLMFAVPGQSHEAWMSSLREAAYELKPEHISFYSLQIEEGTPFYGMFLRGELKETGEAEDRRMYHDAIKLLGNSAYEHYEISNAAKRGFECRHNLKYWSMEEYLGLGLGASSFLGGMRLTNSPELGEYIEKTGKNILPLHSCHINSSYDMSSEYIFTGLRKRKGIDLSEFQAEYGEQLTNRDKVKYYVNTGQLVLKDGFLSLSEEAIDISNGILADII